MCLSGLCAVPGSHQTFPGRDGSMPCQSKSHDWARAHECRQTWKKWLSVMLGVEVTALLGAQLKLTFLVQCEMMEQNQQIITITNILFDTSM